MYYCFTKVGYNGDIFAEKSGTGRYLEGNIYEYLLSRIKIENIRKMDGNKICKMFCKFSDVD